MVVKFKRELLIRKIKEGEEKLLFLVFRSVIKQVMRMKCNIVIFLQKKQVLVYDIYKNFRFLIDNFLIVFYVEVIIVYFYFYLMENDF